MFYILQVKTQAICDRNSFVFYPIPNVALRCHELSSQFLYSTDIVRVVPYCKALQATTGAKNKPVVTYILVIYNSLYFLSVFILFYFKLLFLGHSARFGGILHLSFRLQPADFPSSPACLCGRCKCYICHNQIALSKLLHLLEQLSCTLIQFHWIFINLFVGRCCRFASYSVTLEQPGKDYTNEKKKVKWILDDRYCFFKKINKIVIRRRCTTPMVWIYLYHRGLWGCISHPSQRLGH